MSARRLPLVLVVACALLTAGGALAANARGLMKVVGSCAGDTISGRVVARAPRGTVFTVRLLQRKTADARWTAVGRRKRFRSRGVKQTFRFRYDVSAFAAAAYRLRLTRSHRRVLSAPISSTSCAPGHQVPEAPLALLLPLSLVAVGGGALLLRRRAAI